eukprot:TRINITY_DN1312_c0_g1_i1.p1 TRINITY_DN1312_c0_g1~~TRINITY_DN1312_c0_g1_i1.p1  ORF type:complete len:254 (-),score=52.89 TRINITY_DN1312_c0_g1_i1:90-851(-)
MSGVTGKRIYLGNLPHDANKELISEICSRYGKIVNIEHLAKRRVAFVTFLTEQDAVGALEGLSRQRFAGQWLRVDWPTQTQETRVDDSSKRDPWTVQEERRKAEAAKRKEKKKQAARIPLSALTKKPEGRVVVFKNDAGPRGSPPVSSGTGSGSPPDFLKAVTNSDSVTKSGNEQSTNDQSANGRNNSTVTPPQAEKKAPPPKPKGGGPQSDTYRLVCYRGNAPKPDLKFTVSAEVFDSVIRPLANPDQKQQR